MARLVNKSIKSKVVPCDCIIVTVVPIFKQEKKGDPGDYRSVSLASIMYEALEKTIKDSKPNEKWDTIYMGLVHIDCAGQT